ncbi:hypothetical protein SERLA73DRAFT_149082 [Serpula lacrymans var. lacrymans S7.3]|uniref:Uncharacterized protein n=1 Tax=Serpula lacrymans var. lacrymans (strain S7.3) TaxID=936435 RepID=F8PEZ2_SERL3|nr:hypothetical protein SERLA73DRAFT_149082 [Serpula lacrymans var. lacrymans S7.3]
MPVTPTGLAPNRRTLPLISSAQKEFVLAEDDAWDSIFTLAHLFWQSQINISEFEPTSTRYQARPPRVLQQSDGIDAGNTSSHEQADSTPSGFHVEKTTSPVIRQALVDELVLVSVAAPEVQKMPRPHDVNTFPKHARDGRPDLPVCNERPFKSKQDSGSTCWFKSSSQGPISAPSSRLRVGVSDIYIHENLLDKSKQVWLRLEDGWLSITAQYLMNSLTIVHPLNSLRVLRVQPVDETPSWILKSTKNVYNHLEKQNIGDDYRKDDMKKRDLARELVAAYSHNAIISCVAVHWMKAFFYVDEREAVQTAQMIDLNAKQKCVPALQYIKQMTISTRVGIFVCGLSNWPDMMILLKYKPKGMCQKHGEAYLRDMHEEYSASYRIAYASIVTAMGSINDIHAYGF